MPNQAVKLWNTQYERNKYLTKQDAAIQIATRSPNLITGPIQKLWLNADENSTVGVMKVKTFYVLWEKQNANNL